MAVRRYFFSHGLLLINTQNISVSVGLTLHGSTALFALPSLSKLSKCQPNSSYWSLFYLFCPFLAQRHVCNPYTQYPHHTTEHHSTHESYHTTPPLSWPGHWATGRGPAWAPERCRCMISSQVQDHQSPSINTFYLLIRFQCSFRF